MTDHEEVSDVVVSQGQIIVNSVLRVVSSPNVVVYEVDCRAKYPGTILSHNLSKAGLESWTLILFSDDQTLYTEDIDKRTYIDFPALDGKIPWWVFIDRGRYSVRIAFVQPGQIETVYYRD